MKHYNPTNDNCTDLIHKLGDDFFDYCSLVRDETECSHLYAACGTTDDGRTTMTIDEDVLCKDLETYYPIRKNDQRYDNIKFYIRPLECKLAQDYFRELQYFGSEESFYENCVDLEAGDAKPQIRVHGRAAFNITNFAQFENIEFTGEDNLVDFVSIDADEDMMKDIIEAAPFKFCEYQEEASLYLTAPNVTNFQGVNDRFNYTCYSGYNVDNN